MTLWPLLRSLPRIADTLLDLVRLSQEQNLLLRELYHAQTTRTAQTIKTRLHTARRTPLDPDDESRAASRRPPASGDQVWRMTRPMLDTQERERQDRKVHPHRYPNPQRQPAAELSATSPLSPDGVLQRHLDRQRPSRTDSPPPPTR